MDNKRFAFGKENFILLSISLVIIIIGFCLMAGAKTTEETGFNPEIFDTQRIVIAPIITISGFLMVIWAILKKSKN